MSLVEVNARKFAKHTYDREAQQLILAPQATGAKILDASGSIQAVVDPSPQLENVVRRVIWLTSQDASTKLLVFSSWKDVLALVSHALNGNNVPHLYPKDGKHFDAAITEFKQSSGVGHSQASRATGDGAELHPQILLLLVKQGGNGLNLTEAQHVLLVEPLLDPGVEAQAVGRVHRIGQTRPTYVHRFVVGNTIEENVYRLGQQRAAAMDLSAAAVKRQASSKERGGLTVRDVALLLREAGHQPWPYAETVAAEPLS